MFEDSLVESIGRIRTRSRRYAVGTTLLEAALVGVLVLVPYLYPAGLPPRLLRVPLVSPPPAAPPAPPQIASAPAARPVNLELLLTAPTHIPAQIARVPVAASEPPRLIGIGPESGIPVLSPGPSAPPLPRVRLEKPSGPTRISSGVAAGQLLAPIQPQYPAIALAAHVQGTVVVAATISASGYIENLRVLGGPPMLVSAAVSAIRQARYRPYLLNGEPVPVATTINVQFVLGQ
ncbi:MAG TPA: energy transducer TonB [Acidobacteriaceae bacterium]|nr:energy transducer TonB [Acidobacteriaceae bacterium]